MKIPQSSTNIIKPIKKSYTYYSYKKKMQSISQLLWKCVWFNVRLNKYTFQYMFCEKWKFKFFYLTTFGVTEQKIKHACNSEWMKLTCIQIFNAAIKNKIARGCILPWGQWGFAICTLSVTGMVLSSETTEK